MSVIDVTVCELGGLANKLTDGVWTEIPCDPSSQWVCWTHKMRHMGGNDLDKQLGGGFAFKQANIGNYTQREIHNDNVAGLAPGDEMQRGG